MTKIGKRSSISKEQLVENNKNYQLMKVNTVEQYL